MASLLPDGLLQELAERFGPQFSQLDEASRLAVATARIEGRVTNARLRQVTNRHPRDLTFILGDLVKSGMLAAHGDRRGTWYSLPGPEAEGAAHGLAQTNLDLSQSLPQSAPGLSQSLPQSGLGLSQSSSKRDALEGGEKAQRIAAGRWATQAAVKEAIVELCRGRFLMAREIAEAINRAPKTLRNKYLPELVASGLLELRNPLQPNRADQAYRTADAATPKP